MLYRAVQGSVQDSHYGLVLAQVVPLPPQVLSDATYMARRLERRLLQTGKPSKSILSERRRKLILNLQEHLAQAYKGPIQGELLSEWMKELRREFIIRMTTINDEATADHLEFDSADCDDQDDEEEALVVDASLGDKVSNERAVTGESRISVISTDTGFMATESLPTALSASEIMSSVRAVSDNER